MISEKLKRIVCVLRDYFAAEAISQKSVKTAALALAVLDVLHRRSVLVLV